MNKLKNRLNDKIRKYDRRKHRSNVRTKVLSDLPRLIVNRSNQFNYAQIVGLDGKVLAYANDVKSSSGTKSESAKAVGVALAKIALKNGVESVVFDRNGFLYHGRVKSIADGAREGGLKF